jgi:ABC-type oligopeptide transport system substrate-binding subunit
VPTQQLPALKSAGLQDVRTLPSRRVYFLALNNRVPALANQDLRRAFAHALDRKVLLNDHFRGGIPPRPWLVAADSILGVFAAQRQFVPIKHHRPLNGPYPPDSWACCPPPRVEADLHDLGRARAFARDARTALGKPDKLVLSLKFPNDDPHVAAACADIAEQLQRLGASVDLPLHIKLEGLPPRELHEAIAQRKYDLAYWFHDHATEAYWLWPLFDTRAEALAVGGSNYLGYENDAALGSLLKRAMEIPDFTRVKELTHDVHAHLVERMPLIPLWQFDTHLVVHPHLHPTRLDPLLIFDNVEEWKLVK